MPRPKRQRNLQKAPKSFGFKPMENNFGKSNECIELQLDEFEALRLADYKGLSQFDAAKLMDISRPTFTRIYDSALKKIVKAMVENRGFVISGGDVSFENDWFRCHDCDDVFSEEESHECDTDDVDYEHINHSLNRGKNHAQHLTSALGFCECKKCQHIQRKLRGETCRNTICIKCGQKGMTRTFTNKKDE